MNGWEIAGVVLCVLLIPSIGGLLFGNCECDGTIGKLYGRVKISNTAFYVWSRDKLKRTNWLELGHIENMSGTRRGYTITIFLFTAQIGWLGERKTSTKTKTESSFECNGKTYTGSDTLPEDVKQAYAEMRKARDELFMTADELLKRFKGDK